MNLSLNEWTLINEISYKIHSIENLVKMRLSILELIKILIPYNAATFYLADPHTDQLLKDPVGINISSKSLYSYIDIYKEIDNTRWIFLCPSSTVYLETSLLADTNREEAPYYKTFYSPNNIHFSVFLTLIFNGDFVGIMTLYRAKDQPDFSEKEVFILNILKEHLAFRLYTEENKVRPFDNKTKDVSPLIEKYNLTLRESEIVRLLMEELSDADICSKLFISQNTLKKHIGNIYKKFGFKNRLQLYKYIIS